MGCDEGQCGCESGCGCNGSKGCGCGQGSGCEMTDMVMAIADKAWAELMKEKMKAELEKKRGAQMSKVAAAAVDASVAYWSAKMEGKSKREQHKDALRKAFQG